MSSMFRIMWTTVVALYMWQLVDVVEAFQVGTTTTTTTGIPRHWHAPKIAPTGVNALQPYAASLFAGHISEQQYQRRRRQHRQQKSPRLWQAKTNVDDKNNKANTTLAVKVRKFIMSLFRLLMAPLRLFRSSAPKVVESDVATTKIVPELVDESISIPSNVVEVTAPVVTPLKEKVEEEQVSAPVAIPLVQNETPPTPVVEAAPIKVVSTKATSAARPVGDRWATATVDLSGDWILIISDEFKEQYDEYLKRLGQPMIVRGIALGIIGLTSEYTEQTDEGRSLFIRGINARGLWERTLVASGADGSNETYEPIERIVVTADDEKVRAEAWWEEGGTVHMSWMRGVTKYGGGDFESKRYLEQDGKVLVCESIFYPQDQKREKASVTWKFVRKGATL